MRMIKCKICSKEIPSNAKICPECGTKNNRPLYKRPWFIIIAFFIIIGVIGAINKNLSTAGSQSIQDNMSIKSAETKEPINESIPEINSESVEPTQEIEPSQETKSSQEPEESTAAEEPQEEVPREYQSALSSAETYSSIMHMSKAEIYNQLISEYGDKFAPEAAQYAIDNIQADWKENALQSAESYNENMHMSKAEMYDQLTSEYGSQFTAEEAQYAIDNIQADWKENALKTAESYSENMHMSKSAIYDQLVSDYGNKFTAEEAQYAIDNMQ